MSKDGSFYKRQRAMHERIFTGYVAHVIKTIICTIIFQEI